MKKRNTNHEKRVKKLLVACSLCAIILTVSTYAWFIGMKKVNVKAFEVSIATTESLALSLDGEAFSDSITISKENLDEVSYDGHTNSWGGEGLVPMSSVGKIDSAKSRLILYEKGSFTATEGGYRVMAARANNEGNAEARGYVAFDLFIRNISGEEYYQDFNIANEEAIYLTPESAVTIADAGANKGNSGIENSVRVGFAQIGRVKIGTDTPTITGINCAGGGSVTSICSRDAQIWEPNDTKHVSNAINWYDKACKERTGADVTSSSSYGAADTCGDVVDGTAYPTYAVSGEINWSDNVDVYDGEEYNGYTGSISDSAQTGKLMKFDYFTDSMKDLRGTDRPEFMRLAPNSITKVRVYIWIEGQDVDNYDFASLGKKISVSFGFTKQRFYGEDVEYDNNPELPEGLDKRPATAGE